MSGIHETAPDPGEPAHPRVVFAAFRASDDPMLLAWGRFRERILTASRMAEGARPFLVPPARPLHPPATAGGVGVSGIWRLLASNNRELGRSFHLYSSFDSARAHVLRLAGATSDMDVDVLAGPTGGTHGWVISVAGTPVMTCGRWYSSPSATGEAAAGTIAALPKALVSLEAHHAAPSGRRSRRFVTRDHALSW